MWFGKKDAGGVKGGAKKKGKWLGLKLKFT